MVQEANRANSTMTQESIAESGLDYKQTNMVDPPVRINLTVVEECRGTASGVICFKNKTALLRTSHGFPK